MNRQALLKRILNEHYQLIESQESDELTQYIKDNADDLLRLLSDLTVYLSVEVNKDAA